MKRKSILTILPKAYEAMRGLETFMRSTKLDPVLKQLIKIRASQLNGCAYCIDMHSEEALDLGESNRRLFAIAAWHESPLFTDEERVVLQLAEEVTLVGENGVTDETYEAALEVFGEETTAQIVLQAVIINMWNRLMVAGKEEYVSKYDQ